MTDRTTGGRLGEDLRPIATNSIPNYATTIDAPVDYAPVSVGGRTIGFVFWSQEHDVVGWQALGSAGDVGFNTGAALRRKLREAKAQALSASAAVEWLAHAQKARAATIDLGSPEQANSSTELAAVAAAQ
jgi:hypothetical protein